MKQRRPYKGVEMAGKTRYQESLKIANIPTLKKRRGIAFGWDEKAFPEKVTTNHHPHGANECYYKSSRRGANKT